MSARDGFIKRSGDDRKSEDVQIIGIAENSLEQIKSFNSNSENEWSDIRKAFKLSPVAIPLIGECDDSAIDEEKKRNSNCTLPDTREKNKDF